MYEARYSREDAHELILAEWRSLHPKPMDSLRAALPIFVEQVRGVRFSVTLHRGH